MAARTAEHRGRALTVIGRHVAALAALACLAAAPWSDAQAGALHYCDRPATLSAQQQDQLLRFGAVIKATLDASGADVALIARSGLDLQRFGVRYSHAGFSLKDGLDTPWAVRQLYFACDEQRPRLFDQGIAGFLLGLDDPSRGHVSVVLLPAASAAALQRAVLDKRQALALLGARYSASAYPFSQRYQNCNQWVAEMLASAWRPADDTAATAAPDAANGDADPRAQAQRWLQRQGYQPSVFDVTFPPLQWLGALIPWLPHDDHPRDAIAAQRLTISMPAAIEAFVRASVPGAARIEFCHRGGQVVVHRGWTPMADGCRPGAGDAVVHLIPAGDVQARSAT